MHSLHGEFDPTSEPNKNQHIDYRAESFSDVSTPECTWPGYTNNIYLKLNRSLFKCYAQDRVKTWTQLQDITETNTSTSEPRTVLMYLAQGMSELANIVRTA